MKNLFSVIVFTAFIHQFAHAEPPGLDGKWSMGCVADRTTSEDDGISEQYLFNESQAQRALLFFRDSDCTQLISSTTLVGSFLLGEQYESAHIKPNFKLDLLWEKLLYTVHDAQTVSEFNLNKSCDFSDWQVDIPKDITGRSCSEFVAQTKEYSIAKILNTKEILVGNLSSSTWDGSTEEKRTRDVSPFVYFLTK